MTRAPKFRAWLREEKEMILADLMEWDDDGFEGIGDRITFWKDADEIEIMQSTNLKDKNGAEIYENDILKLDGLAGLFEVRRANSGLYKLFRRSTPYDLVKLIDWIGYVEVVGNVYENKELLE